MTVVEDFAADYFVSRSITPARRKLVLGQLSKLSTSAGKPPEQATDKDVRGYINELLDGGLHVNSVRIYQSALLVFFRWCWREGIIDSERWLRIDDIPTPRGATSRHRPKPYKTKEIQRFWSELDERWPLQEARFIDRYARGITPYRRIWKHAMHLQMQAIVSLALFHGLRRSEIRTIALDDLHPDNDYLVVRAKSPFGELQGYREVPYIPEGRRMVGEWLDMRAVLKPEHDCPWLLLSIYASPNRRLASHPLDAITADSFELLLPKIGAWELHRFRHTCATEWLRAGVEIEKVSRLLGHASIGQTLGYAELVRTDIARGMERHEQDFMTAVGRRNQYMLPQDDAA